MKFSQLFTKTIKEVPSEESATNAQLLIKGGFIQKIMSGVYVFLPLGLRVLDKISHIVREEMNAVGGQELHMSVLQNKETWTTTGRWEVAKDVMYQFEDASGKETGLGWTHEEPLTELARHFISSYKDLPKAVYQIQTKFRNEARAKSGILRGREFLMKDLYSFHASEEDLNNYYEKVASAYGNVFKRIGLPALRTLASGGLFSKFSDEYQTLSEVGEDNIFFCEKCSYAANQEVAKELELSDTCPKCKGSLKQGNSIEVGNIFKLGTKFSDAFGLQYTDPEGKKHPVIMASYGIGVSRLVGALVEVFHDEKGIIWPESVAPFKVHIVALEGGMDKAQEIYGDLTIKGIEVLFDDREGKTAGEKFADADLIGCPTRIIVSKKTLEKDSVEIKKRNEKEFQLVPVNSYSSVI